MRNLLKRIPINMKLTFACILCTLIVALIYYPLVPILLNYPPDSINTPFQIEVNYFYYTTQYIAIVCFVILAILITFPFIFKKTNKLSKAGKIDKNNISNKTLKDIKSCFNIPIFILLAFTIFPPILIFIGLLALKQELVFSIKVTAILFSMCVLLGLLIYTFTRILFENVLKKMNLTDHTYGIRFNLKNKTLVQLLSLLLFTVSFAFLIFYSQFTKIKGDYLFVYYKEVLNSSFENKELSSIEQAKEILNSIEFESPSDSYFILYSNGDTCYSKETLSNFFTSYALTFEDKYEGHTYEYYGNAVQGAFIRKNIAGNDYLLGIRYSVFTNDTLTAILSLFIIAIAVNIFFIFLIAITYGNNLKLVVTNLSNMSKNASKPTTMKLPVYSNDEIGDLTIAFNKIQDMTNNYVEKIHSNQETLMERERLASLGQLIGGIAHNLKTPIMSISGATEGLSDLIKEYDSSIDDPEVNSQDHHDIAKDMNSWIIKIKEYTEYMSDIITAVKGQAVTLSETENVTFDVEELLKRVNILMRHELKNAIIYLNISVKVDEHKIIHGDVNSLVQVINNMISNSIQAYQGKTEQNIDLIVEEKDNNLCISIKDYGCGLPKKVKNKLFKEMITTKGKNGTGLGLYMSYSTIKAHFGGDITFESEEGKGTTFTITLPL